MKIGDRIYITEELKMNNKVYPIGHQFVIIGSSPRGWDIKDDEGNTVYETLFISHTFKSISAERNYKIEQILKK